MADEECVDVGVGVGVVDELFVELDGDAGGVGGGVGLDALVGGGVVVVVGLFERAVRRGEGVGVVGVVNASADASPERVVLGLEDLDLVGGAVVVGVHESGEPVPGVVGGGLSIKVSDTFRALQFCVAIRN